MTHHVYPIHDRQPHRTHGTWCWCAPKLRNLCPECLNDEEQKKGCFVCAGEGDVDAVADGQPDLVIHNLGGP